MPRFYLKAFRKLIDDKLVTNKALQVVIEMRDKMEDQIEAKECSNKDKLQKDKQKTQQNFLIVSRRLPPTRNLCVDMTNKT